MTYEEWFDEMYLYQLIRSRFNWIIESPIAYEEAIEWHKTMEIATKHWKLMKELYPQYVKRANAEE